MITAKETTSGSKAFLSGINSNTRKIPDKELIIKPDGTTQEKEIPSGHTTIYLDAQDLMSKLPKPVLNPVLTEGNTVGFSGFLRRQYTLNLTVSGIDKILVVYPFGRKFNPEHPTLILPALYKPYKFTCKSSNDTKEIEGVPDPEGLFLTFDIDGLNMDSFVMSGTIDITSDL